MLEVTVSVMWREDPDPYTFTLRSQIVEQEALDVVGRWFALGYLRVPGVKGGAFAGGMRIRPVSAIDAIEISKPRPVT